MNKRHFQKILAWLCLLSAATVTAAPLENPPVSARELPAAPEMTDWPQTPPSPAATAASIQESGLIGGLLGQANELIGVPYRNGGTSPDSGFDCSGFVSYLFKNTLGMNLPRSSKDMSRVGEKVDKTELQPGDLLFFKTVTRGISHVGIYVGNGAFIHSPWLGRSVEVAHLGLKYWTNRFVVAKRLDLPATARPVAQAETLHPVTPHLLSN